MGSFAKAMIKKELRQIWNYLPIPERRKAVWRYKIGIKKRDFFQRRDKSKKICDEILKKYKEKSLSEAEKKDYAEKLESLKKKYKQIHIIKSITLQIGPLCMDYAQLIDYIESMDENVKIFFLLYTYNEQEYIYNEVHPKISNQYFLKKFKEKIEIINAENVNFLGYVIQNTKDFVKGGEFDCQWNHGNFRVREHHKFYHGDAEYPQKKYLRFTEEERYEGNRMLEKMGIQREYCCFFSRSNEYHIQYRSSLKNDPMQYITGLRNSNITDFIPMCEQLGKYNVQAVRVGALDSREIKGSNIIDYTNSERSEFMDFFIMENAEFFIGDPSGIMNIPFLCCIPVALTNNVTFFWEMPEMQNYNNRHCMTIYKKWWSKKRCRYLTLTEMLEFQSMYGVTGEAELMLLDKGEGIEFISNTEKEICELGDEMLKRLKGVWIETEEEIQLRKRFWELVNYYYSKADEKFVLFDFEPSTTYLKHNQWWLA